MEAVTLRRGVNAPRSRIGELIRAPGAAGWLLIIVLASCAYAAVADGGTGVSGAAKVQSGIAAALLFAGVALAAGALEPARSRPAWMAAGLLAGLALWSALATGWSPAPDEGWVATNRVASYAAVVVICLLVAPRIRGAPIALAVGITTIALIVAVYSLGGKLFPGLQIGPIDLDHASRFARLRSPIGYWNALGLLMVIAAPACIWLAASAKAREPLRVAAWLALQILIVTAALTYSRGAIVALAVVLAVMVLAGPDRLARLATTVTALGFAAAPVAFAFSRPELSENGVAAVDRAAEGELLALCLAGSLIAAAGAWRIGHRAAARIRWDQERSSQVWRGLALLAIGIVALGGGALQASERGLTGTVSEQWSEFREPVAAANQPNRLVSASSSNRWIWWREAAGAFSDKRFAGWGSGSFPTIHTLYRDSRSEVRSAHSLPLQTLAEYGLVGFALLLGGLLLLGGAALRGVIRSEGAERGARSALLAIFAAWLIHSLYDWDWEIPAVTLPALAAAAFAASPAAPRSGANLWIPEGRPSPRAVPVAIGAAALASVMVVAAVLPALSQSVRLDAASGDTSSPAQLQRMSKDAALAARLNPLAVEPLFAQASLASASGNTKRSELLLIRAVKLQPDNFRTWQRLAQVESLLLNGRVASIAYSAYARTNPLEAVGAGKAFSGSIFAVALPPRLSPTALGTPPP